MLNVNMKGDNIIVVVLKEIMKFHGYRSFEGNDPLSFIKQFAGMSVETAVVMHANFNPRLNDQTFFILS